MVAVTNHGAGARVFKDVNGASVVVKSGETKNIRLHERAITLMRHAQKIGQNFGIKVGEGNGSVPRVALLPKAVRQGRRHIKAPKKTGGPTILSAEDKMNAAVAFLRDADDLSYNQMLAEATPILGALIISKRPQQMELLDMMRQVANGKTPVWAGDPSKQPPRPEAIGGPDDDDGPGSDDDSEAGADAGDDDEDDGTGE